ncbi:MAG: SDR family NAD(P)-dependent oxidoreductase [Candidatus Bathyarchaeia archaeon]
MCEEGRFKGKVVIVTGGGSGIGRAIALRFAREGASVVIFDLAKERCEEVAREAEALGERALAIVGDVTKSGDIEGVVEATMREFGRIDILVNNVGGRGAILLGYKGRGLE